MERLDRFLAEESDYSRSEVKKLIRAGRISVNGLTDVRPELKIDPQQDRILADGIRIVRSGRILIMMNKPAGVLSATQDKRDRTVINLVREPYAKKLFPAGRLDRDTEGLLLLTNDGALAHHLLAPGKHVTKTYFVVLSGQPDAGIADRFREGMDIGERRITLPAHLVFLPQGEEYREETDDGAGMPADEAQRLLRLCRITLKREDYDRCGEDACCAAVALTEGKFHQIKRMFASCGREVRYLKRIAMGNLALDPDLERGAYRLLTAEEAACLESGTGQDV